MWMWKVEHVALEGAEIKLNVLSSHGWEIVTTHVSDVPGEMMTLVIIARKETK